VDWRAASGIVLKIQLGVVVGPQGSAGPRSINWWRYWHSSWSVLLLLAGLEIDVDVPTAECSA